MVGKKLAASTLRGAPPAAGAPVSQSPATGTKVDISGIATASHAPLPVVTRVINFPCVVLTSLANASELSTMLAVPTSPVRVKITPTVVPLTNAPAEPATLPLICVQPALSVRLVIEKIKNVAGSLLC